jgi:hypothetical protein
MDSNAMSAIFVQLFGRRTEQTAGAESDAWVIAKYGFVGGLVR